MSDDGLPPTPQESATPATPAGPENRMIEARQQAVVHAKNAARLTAQVTRSAASAARETSRKHNILAIVALLVSSLAVVMTLGLLAPVGAILGHLARRQIKTTGQTGKGMATAAIVIGWTAVAVVPCVALLTGGALIMHIVSLAIGLFT